MNSADVAMGRSIVSAPSGGVLKIPDIFAQFPLPHLWRSAPPGLSMAPMSKTFDVIIIGGGMVGASVAFWLAKARAGLRIAVIERDPSYEFASTTHTNSCIRQQFGTETNIRLSQFTAGFIGDFKTQIEDETAPPIALQSFGYLYLASTEDGETRLRRRQALGAGLGTATQLLSADQIAARFPFYNLEGIRLGSLNEVDEGYFDGAGIFAAFRRRSRDWGVEWHTGEVTGLTMQGPRITGVTLADGRTLSAGHTVNAAGPRAAQVARMAGVDLPVAPRRRYTFLFEAAEALPCALPLTIDPSGFHVRADGRAYMTGCPPLDDGPADWDDFHMEPDVWEERLWPALAHRIPAFERLRMTRFWTGHYAYNDHDQNALVGFWPGLEGLIFANGFSGHGLQQAPGIGRGVAELILHGQYQALDLSELAIARITEGRRVVEDAII